MRYVSENTTPSRQVVTKIETFIPLHGGNSDVYKYSQKMEKAMFSLLHAANLRKNCYIHVYVNIFL